MAARSHTLLWGVVLLAIALRFPTLDVQSFWADEAATVDVLRNDTGDLLAAVRDQESTPPLYYVLAWLWTQVMGDGEVGLRSLSAVLGVLTVPVAHAVGRRVGGERAGLFAAVLVATNPLLVWFSQEARAYALLVLLAAVSLLLVLRAAEEPARVRLIAWGVAAGLLFATHYYALFLVVGEVAWLTFVLRGRLRPLVVAIGPAAIAGAALLPLSLDQRSGGRASFIAQEDLGRRLAQVPKQFLIGYDAPFEVGLGIAAAAVTLLAFAGLARPRGPEPAAGVSAVVAAAVGGLVIPLVLAIAGEDYLVTRNLIAALVPLLVLAGAGAARHVPARIATSLCLTLALVGLATVTGVNLSGDGQREDWRDGIASLDAAPAVRAVVARPGSGRVAVELYLGRRARPLSGLVAVDAIDVVAVGTGDIEDAPDGLVPSRLPVAGAVAGPVRRGSGWASRRFMVPRGTVIDPAGLESAAPGSAILGVGLP